MVLNMGDQFIVWRTGGGLYIASDGQIGKLCALRQNPFGGSVSAPRAGRQYELVRTPYGWRQRPLEAVDVRPGMSLFIEMAAEWTQTSAIHDVFQGVRVDGMTPGYDYLVYTAERAAIVPDGDIDRAQALLKSGWEGAPERLGDWANGIDLVIVRIDRAFLLTESSSVEHHDAPGWAGILQYLANRLRAADERIVIMSSGYSADGLLSLRLSGVPTDPHGRPIEAVRTAVEAAEQAALHVCSVCGAPGSVVTAHPETLAASRVALCEEHAAEQAAEEVSSHQAVEPLPAELDGSPVRVDPGWFPLVSELHRGVSALTPYTFRTCRQHLGSLLVLIDLPEGTPAEIVEQVKALRLRAQELAERTCEHTGAAGARVAEPWVHICSGDCPLPSAERTHPADLSVDMTRGVSAPRAAMNA